MAAGLGGSDAARVAACLGRLLPHLEMNGVALTGGLAVQVGLSSIGRECRRNRVADLDFVLSAPEALRSSVVGPFLVSHYHVAQSGVPKFLVQLVDPASRLRVDFFPDLAESIADARVTAIGAHRIPVLPLSRIFDHKVQTLSRASAAAPIDPKHVEDAETLGAALGRSAAPVPPESLARELFDVGPDGTCARCELSRRADWPLAARSRIFDLLAS